MWFSRLFPNSSQDVRSHLLPLREKVRREDELNQGFLPAVSNPFVFIGIEFTNVVLWFSSGVSLAVFLSRLLFCRGSVCTAAQTDAVLAYVLLCVWCGTFVPLAMDFFKSGFRRRGAAGQGAGMKEVA